MAEDPNGCGCGCAGCFPLIAGAFVWTVASYIGLTLLGILAGVLIAGVLISLGGWGLWRLTRGRRSPILTDEYPAYQSCPLPRPATQQPQPKKDDHMGTRDPITTIKNWGPDDIAELPAGARAIVSEIQQTLKNSTREENFLEFVRQYPIDSRWVSKEQGSNIRVRILAVDHRWSGDRPALETVIIHFEHIDSKHQFHWPVRAFAERWVVDPEEDF